MTEKRFILDDDGIVTDMVDLSMYIDNEDCCEKLNELNDKNQQLKHHLELYQPNKDERSNFDLNLCCEENNKLLEENKKLKKENEQLKQFQDRVFSWIDMHLQRLPTLIDDEFNSDNEFADPSLYSGALQILETMKKELKGDVE